MFDLFIRFVFVFLGSQLSRSYLQQFLTLRLALCLLQVIRLVCRGHDARLARRGRAELRSRQGHGGRERRGRLLLLLLNCYRRCRRRRLLLWLLLRLNERQRLNNSRLLLLLLVMLLLVVMVMMRGRLGDDLLGGLDVNLGVHHVAVAPALGNALAVLPDGGDGAAGEAEFARHVALAFASLDLLYDLHLLLDREREPLATLRMTHTHRAARPYRQSYPSFFLFLFLI